MHGSGVELFSLLWLQEEECCGNRLGVLSGKEHRGSVPPVQQAPGNWPHLVPWLGTAVPGFCLLDNKGFAVSLKKAVCQ